MTGRLSASLVCIALLFILGTAYANHHPGDMQPMPSKPSNPIWNIVGIAILAGIAYIIWKAFYYKKKISG